MQAQAELKRVTAGTGGGGGGGTEAQSWAAGTVTFAYYDPATLAMELHIIASRRDLKDYRIIDGGIMYLAGEEHYFCSALLHFALTGSVAPPLTRTAWIKTWMETVPFREVEATMAQMKKDMPNIPRGSTISPSNLHTGHPQLDPCRNMNYRMFEGQGEPASLQCMFFATSKAT
eukprot:g943.t1